MDDGKSIHNPLIIPVFRVEMELEKFEYELYILNAKGLLAPFKSLQDLGRKSINTQILTRI